MLYESSGARSKPTTPAALALCGILAGCRGEPTPPLVAAPAVSAEEAPVEADSPAQAARARDLWFESGPGRQAILARERKDHAAASALLDELLATKDLDANDRGAAQWLRALEDVAADQPKQAASRLAEAAKAPALAPVVGRIRLLQARAHLDAGEPTLALAAVAKLDPGPALRDELLIVSGDARARADDPARARADYEAYLREFSSRRRAHEVRAKLARVLSEQTDRSSAERALELYEKLAIDVPLSDYGREALDAIPKLQKRAASKRSRSAHAAIERARALARIDAHFDRRQYRATVRAVDTFLRRRGLSATERCRATYKKASAVFRQRKRADARPVYERAAGLCQQAKERERQVKSLYQAARGSFAEGKHTRAAKAFEDLAKRFSDHSYADDALVLAGESWAEAGKPDQASEAYRRASAIKGGDMGDEARRRLIVTALAAGDHKAALDLCDRAIAAGIRGKKARAKAHYFRGRALAGLGKDAEARTAWLEVLRVLPLDYAALQALSRLRELGEEPYRTGLTLVHRSREKPPSMPSLELPSGPAVSRSKILARLGLGTEAGDELRAAGIDGWPAARLLDQAGLYSEAQRLIARKASAWRSQGPQPDFASRTMWRLAHPLAFEALVEEREQSYAVPAFLTFAVMQTESRFDPAVTSWAGARGLIQLMPKTAKGVARGAGVELRDPDRLFDPALNLDLGMRHLGQLIEGYGGDPGAVALAVASYNAGAGSVKRWLRERGTWELDLFIESIPYDETRKYTQSVLGRWLAYRWIYAGERPDIPRLPLALPSPRGDRG